MITVSQLGLPVHHFIMKITGMSRVTLYAIINKMNDSHVGPQEETRSM